MTGDARNNLLLSLLIACVHNEHSLSHGVSVRVRVVSRVLLNMAASKINDVYRIIEQTSLLLAAAALCVHSV